MRLGLLVLRNRFEVPSISSEVLLIRLWVLGISFAVPLIDYEERVINPRLPAG